MARLLPFKPFDERAAVRIYSNSVLPHWRQDGCTYFVTFRLADSVSQPVLNEWKYERDAWLRVRGIDPAISDWKPAIGRLSLRERRIFERLFVGKLFGYLDRGHGDCVLRVPEICELLSRALLYFDSHRCDTGDFVVMPNHVHILLTPYPEFELEDLLHSIKSYTSNQFNRKLNRTGTHWMEESYDHVVRDAGGVAQNPNLHP